MSNSYYNHTTYPTPNSPGSSSTLRLELDAITTGFSLLPTLAANGYKVAMVNSAGTALIASSALQSLAITLSTLNSTPIGASSASTGAFTTVSATTFTGALTGNASTATALATSRTIGGTSFDGTANVTSFPVPGAIGGTTPSTGAFTTVSATTFTGALTGNASTATALATARTIGGTSFDGTANVTSFPVPGAIGGTTPSTGAFTTVSATTFTGALTGNASTATALATSRTIGGTSFDGTANVTSFPVPGAIGGTTPSTGAFTSITASTTLGVTGVATFTAQPIMSSLTASKPVFTDASSGLTSAGTLAYDQGGTGQTSYAAGDIVYASGINTLAKLAIGTSGQRLVVAAGVPSWATDTTVGTVTSVSWTGGIVSVATATTTPAFTIAGTSGGVPYFSSGTTWATSAALAANALVIGGGAGAAPSTTTTGTGVVTALGVNVGSAGAFVVNGGALGSPSSVGTMPAFTLGGTIAGGGNQINNVIIGTTTPLAGSFTTVTATGRSGVTMSGQTSAVSLGQVSTDTTYGLLSFNGAFAATTLTGIWGGAGTPDMVIGVPTSGTIYSRVNNSTVTLLNSTGLAVTGALTATGRSGVTMSGQTSAVSFGQVSSDPTYGLISFNGAFAATTLTGIWGGAGTPDMILNVPTGGSIVSRVANSTGTLLNSTGFQVTNTLSGGTSGTAYSFSGSAPATSLTLDSSGNLGIGTSSPGAKLDVNGDLKVSPNTAGKNTFSLTTNASNDGSLFIKSDTTDKVNIQANGSSYFEGGTVRFISTISVGNSTPSTSGAGITFPATQSASSDANTLDDYEEGTWTPTLTTNGFSAGATLSSATGIYTKIGRLVSVTATLTMSGSTYPSGYVVIGGLIFTVSGASPGSYTGGNPGSGNMGGACNSFSTSIDASPSVSATVSTTWYYSVTYIV